jgi:regulator of ribonuclease activity A
MSQKTSDLCDEHSESVRIASPIFQSYGGRELFSGPVATVKVFEDNSLVREALEQPGRGRVLVVDGGGSLRCALLGDQLALLARSNDWSGVLVYGCIRDSADIGQIELGVKALNTHPLKSVKRGSGERDVPVTFAGITIQPGDHLYADADGVIVAEKPLV